MKIRCECGHIIVDQSDNLPYKAHLIPDTQMEGIFEGAAKLSDFIEAIGKGKRSDWIEENFGEEYPKELTNTAIISDLIMSKLKTRNMYQCESCGRVLIEKSVGAFEFFYPEGKEAKGILN
ncbi:MAG: hypothetical protein R8P61_20770 [Bacteroidia bacterium]|nr:hypothetical protein [Bacteroidia bacterium]